jgi:hypothetical protein
MSTGWRRPGSFRVFENLFLTGSTTGEGYG